MRPQGPPRVGRRRPLRRQDRAARERAPLRRDELLHPRRAARRRRCLRQDLRGARRRAGHARLQGQRQPHLQGREVQVPGDGQVRQGSTGELIN